MRERETHTHRETNTNANLLTILDAKASKWLTQRVREQPVHMYCAAMLVYTAAIFNFHAQLSLSDWMCKNFFAVQRMSVSIERSSENTLPTVKYYPNVISFVVYERNASAKISKTLFFTFLCRLCLFWNIFSCDLLICYFFFIFIFFYNLMVFLQFLS